MNEIKTYRQALEGLVESIDQVGGNEASFLSSRFSGILLHQTRAFADWGRFDLLLEDVKNSCLDSEDSNPALFHESAAFIRGMTGYLKALVDFEFSYELQRIVDEVSTGQPLLPLKKVHEMLDLLCAAEDDPSAFPAAYERLSEILELAKTLEGPSMSHTLSFEPPWEVSLEVFDRALTELQVLHIFESSMAAD